MAVGTVKFYNSPRVTASSSPDDGGKDVFIHATALERLAYATSSKASCGRGWKAYEQLRDTCDAEGPLDRKTVELIKIGISTALEHEGGVVAHISQARKADATDNEINHAILVAMELVGFPTVLAEECFSDGVRHSLSFLSRDASCSQIGQGAKNALAASLACTAMGSCSPRCTSPR